ncbi:MAG TPA: alpha/beta hydrolase [Thermoleophilaceae bacterium]
MGDASWRSDALGPARVLEVAGARIRAHVTGEGPAIVFVHGALVNANLWRKVVPRLDGFTRVTLDLPLGSHLEPAPSADLSAPGLARLISGAVQTLGFEDVTLVGNDTGGGLCQLVAAEQPAWLGGLVLTSCDAFENFPPTFFRVVLAPARIPGAVPVLFGGLRLRALRRLPIAYGWLTHRPIDPAAEDSYVLPILNGSAVRRDFNRVMAGLDPKYTLAAAERLREFERPALIAWSRDDKFFPPEHGERLAALIPGARLEWIDDARTFSAEDRPERVAELIAGFARERAPSTV